MGVLGGSLIGLLLAGTPIGIALMAATVLIVYVDPIMSPNALFRAFLAL